MNKIIPSFLLLTLFIVGTSVVTANEGSSNSGSSRPVKIEINRNENEIRHKLLASNSATFKERREELKEEFKERLQNAKEVWASKSSELKVQLEKIKDEKKQQIVENVDSRIANRNDIWVQHWNNVLERLTKIVDKIESRGKELSSKGKDISSVTTSISTARAAISTAQEKVNAQAGRSYEIHISEENVLGKDVASTITQFHTDVKSVIESLNVARRAVEESFKSLKAII